MKNSLEIWLWRQKLLQQRQLTTVGLSGLDFVINKCKICVMSTTFDSLTDAISDWLNVNCVRWSFVATSFFLVDACAYSGSFWFFFGLATINIFSSANKMMLMSLDDYFSAVGSNGWVCIAVRFTQFSSSAVFEHKHFTRCSAFLVNTWSYAIANVSTRCSTELWGDANSVSGCYQQMNSILMWFWWRCMNDSSERCMRHQRHIYYTVDAHQ